jgi:drug/metabolite transporter (DMT)-like permease
LAYAESTPDAEPSRSRDSMTSAARAPLREMSYATALVALALGAVAMGISPIFVRHARAEGIGPFASAFWRMALALPFLYAWMRLAERDGTLSRKARASFVPATILAGLAFTGDLFFWHLSILATTVANATFFATTAPIVVVLIVWLVQRQAIAGSTLVGLALCLAGGGALIGQSMRVDPERLVGDVYGLVTAVFFAIYFVAVQRARSVGAGAARVSFESGLITTVLLGAVALALEPTIWPTTAAGFGALLALALISQCAGQGLLAVALGRLPAVFSSLIIFLEAVAAAIFGWILLGEALTLVQALGGGLILAGIFAARPR